MWDNTAQKKRHARDFGAKQLKMKRVDVRVRTWGGLTALIWKDR